MVHLSVIIVNYNVKYFLLQAIRYAQKSAAFCLNEKRYSVEIIVVDNNSKDDSVEQVKHHFSNIKLIVNKVNTGFSKANNQGIEIAKGKYVLLLNPDTIVQEDTFLKCINFMEENETAGALGVKMVDGKGIYLPESKRGLPTPKVALYKMLGFSSLFSKSSSFNKYHLGFLDKNKNHEIEILSGAFMFMRKEALDKVGLLDETFFMYGEDIDLSYRIIKGGYKNYYLADTQIVHYKGESTKKGSLNYVRIFYNAMIIFAKKHFANQGAGFMILPIRIGIYVRAFIAIISRFFKQSALFIFDGLTIFGGMYWLKIFYAEQVKNDINFFEPELMMVNVPIYTFIWLTANYFSGGYDSPYKSSKLVQGLLIGTLLISAVYGFLDESLRSSRALIVLGAVWAIFALSIIRKLINLFKTGSFENNFQEKKRVLLVGNQPEVDDAQTFLQKVNPIANIIGVISNNTHHNRIGELNSLQKNVELFNANEVIFCENNVPAQFIINSMEQLGSKREYKIYATTQDCIIGSNSKNTAGDFYAQNTTFNIALSNQKRNKKVFDIIFSLIAVLLFPLTLLFVKKGKTILTNIFSVLKGNKTWVSYNLALNQRLPQIKDGVFTCLDNVNGNNLNDLTLKKLQLLYAEEYTIFKDLKVLLS